MICAELTIIRAFVLYSFATSFTFYVFLDRYGKNYLIFIPRSRYNDTKKRWIEWIGVWWMVGLILGQFGSATFYFTSSLYIYFFIEFNWFKRNIYCLTFKYDLNINSRCVTEHNSTTYFYCYYYYYYCYT